MKKITGYMVSPGMGFGVAVRNDVSSEIFVPELSLAKDQVQSEIKRVRHGISCAMEELSHLRDIVKGEFDQTRTEILQTHLEMLNDPLLHDTINRFIEDEMINAEAAVRRGINSLKDKFKGSDSTLLQQRIEDLSDIESRICRMLSPDIYSNRQELPDNIILIGEEILPTSILDIDRSRLKGIVTSSSGQLSHAAILARAMNVPMISGVTEYETVIEEGMNLLLLADRGELLVQPEEEDLQQYQEVISSDRYNSIIESDSREDSDEALLRIDPERVMLDSGENVSIWGNVQASSEGTSIRKNKLYGVGLFRTEYIYMMEHSAPDVEHQEDIYRTTSEKMGGLPLTVRTFDLGGDKTPSFARTSSDSAMLTLRGLRYSMLQLDLFIDQIRALLKVSENCDIRIMFPMVVGAGEFLQAKHIVEETAREMGISTIPPLGAMIELPSAVLDVDRIAEKADFLSLGTNDLVQHMLAIDRRWLDLIDEYSFIHPAVLKAVKRVVEAAKAADKSLCVCGESAADVNLLPLLMGFGVRCLSINPFQATVVRETLSGIKLKEAEKMADLSIECYNADQVKQLIDESRNL